MQKSKLQFKIQKFHFLAIVFGFAFSVFGFNAASAARLYFEPQELVAGAGKGSFFVNINIDAEKSINTLSIAVKIPQNFRVIDASEANSIVNFWIDRPSFDEASRILSFSGIIPGGFYGEKARLLAIELRPEKEGMGTLSFDKEKTVVYLHSSDGIKDELELREIKIPVVKGKENFPVIIKDADPPEDFRPEISRDPNIFGNKWFLVFATQDKGSGIYYYKVKEGRRDFEIAESPYLLKDQKLKSYIYVRAVDKAGNERIAAVEPRYPMKWYEQSLIWIIIIIGAIAYLIWIKFKNK